MTLAKEIELPLFHLGTYTSRDGTPVEFNDALLRQLEKNTNFVLGSKLLQAPIGYDHPAASSEAHGVLTGARYSNGVLYIKGRNWSDKLVNDVKSFKRLAYSGEFDNAFAYNEPGTGKNVAVGPTVIGLAILGAKRPAIKGLKPLSEVTFAEGVAPADAYMVRQELAKAHFVAEGSEGSRHFGEIDNDSTYFFDEGTDDMDEKEFQKMLDAQAERFEKKLAEQQKSFEEKIASTAVDVKRKGDVAEFTETLTKDKKVNKSQAAKLDAILMHPTVANNKELDQLIRAFAESGSTIIVGGGVAKGKTAAQKRAEFSADDDGEENDDDENPSMLDTLTSKEFAEMQTTPDGERKVNEAVKEFAERFPAKVAKATYADKLEHVRRYVTKRELSED